MNTSRLVPPSLAVFVALFAYSASASAQVTPYGYDFGTTFVLSKDVDAGGRIKLEFMGFFADESGSATIDVICPISGPVERVCGRISVGDELTESSGFGPDSATDCPFHYQLSTVSEPLSLIFTDSFESGDTLRWSPAR